MRSEDKLLRDLRVHLQSSRRGASALRALVRPLLIIVVMCSCGTTKVADKSEPPAGDLVCERDADCTMLNYDFHQCCGFPPGREPFAISRSAVERFRKSECQGGCTADEQGWHRRPSLEGWTAVCIHNTCESRSSKASAGPKDK
jgi:hypothetical protein